MADHIAEQLMDAVETALTGLATTGARVFRNRPDDRELQAAEVPGLLVYLGQEDVEVSSLDPVYAARRDQLVRVAAVVSGTSGIDSTLNQIRKEVEVALAAGVTVAGRLLRPVYGGMVEPERDGEGALPVTRAELLFAFTYFTLSDAPDAHA